MQGANKTVRCDCGYEALADDEDELLTAIQKHAQEAHGIGFTREDAMLVVLRSETNEGGSDA
jgi:predicted small metal-binding protein